jgi:hypothetical protein
LPVIGGQDHPDDTPPENIAEEEYDDVDEIAEFSDDEDAFEEVSMADSGDDDDEIQECKACLQKSAVFCVNGPRAACSRKGCSGWTKVTTVQQCIQWATSSFE